jgi:putative FmdB family regulatory protein
MPTYEYLCHKCQFEWEELNAIADRAVPTENPCPKCKKKAVERAFRSPPVTGSDATLSSGADFKELARKMSRSLTPSAKINMERAAGLRGTKYGRR